MPDKKKKTRNTYYQLTPYGQDKEGSAQKGEAYVVQGHIDNHVIVSVPETMTTLSAQELSKQLEEELGKPIIMLTHNISVLRAKRVKASEVKLLEQKDE
jgi:protein required for attachment to host cells